MIVEMCMSRDVEVAHPEVSLFEAIRRMTSRRIRRLVIIQGRSIVGIVCHRDIVGAFPAHINPFSAVALDETTSPGTVGNVMKAPVITIEADQPVEYAADLMTRNHFGGLPVTQKGRLVGIITESDIFRTFSRIFSWHSKSTRITFDLTSDEDAIASLVTMTRELGLELLSFVSYQDGDRRLAVAHVQGIHVSHLVEKLWNSGHSVINVIRITP
jgi:acetoin utilization protein AcuB